MRGTLGHDIISGMFWTMNIVKNASGGGGQYPRELWGAADRVVTSPAGRIRRFATRANPALQRQVRVSLPQMMEADILKTAAVRLDRIFSRRKMGARLVMMIHDAIWIEAPAKEVQETRRLMDRIMTTAGRLFLDLKVDLSDS